jgi:hypothetical protein
MMVQVPLIHDMVRLFLVGNGKVFFLIIQERGLKKV